MLHQLISTICGIALYSHANACSITLQQSTVSINALVDRKIERMKHDLENTETVQSLKNDYTIAVFSLANILYKKELMFSLNVFSIKIQPNNFIAGVNWRF